MTRVRSRSDSPSTSPKDFKTCGYLVCERDSFMSRMFENTAVSRALSRLKARRKLWYVLDDIRCQLLYFRNESEANQGKEPLGLINVRGAAISLALEENNQFIIHSEGKEYVLVADNHESMMLWVLALQAKQDSIEISPPNDVCNHSKLRKQSSSKSKNSDCNDDQTMSINLKERKSKIIRTHSLRLHGEVKRESAEDNSSHRPIASARSMWTGILPESVFSQNERPPFKSQQSSISKSSDNSDDDTTVSLVASGTNGLELKNNNSSNNSSNTSNGGSSSSGGSTTDSSTPSPTNRCVTHPSPTSSNGTEVASCKMENCKTINRRQFPNASCVMERNSSRESENEGPSDGSDRNESRSKPPLTRTSSLATRTDKLRLLRKMNSEDTKMDDGSSLKYQISSVSATSVSSDSAVGASDCAHSMRIQELESELTTAKCDLAKALNRETSYKSTIEEKMALVSELETQLKLMDDVPEEACLPSGSPTKGAAANVGTPLRRLQEKCRVLQNHNKFLNEEVLKLSKMLQQEQSKMQTKQTQIQRSAAENEQLKRDYVFLFQSSLKITNSDGPETMEVYLYGGAKHKERVLSLLEEARKVNPVLPAYESLKKTVCHVDPFGFRRSFTDECLVLHYICRQLHQHYSTISSAYELHKQHWKTYLRKHSGLQRTKELKTLVRGGIPPYLRSRVWALLYKNRVRDIIEEKGSHYYSYLCSLAPDDERVSQHKRQIALDLLRTMPDNIRFADANADGVKKMQEVLQAFCLHNPVLGYCQGMNFLVGMCLLFLEPEDAFWCLVAITERYFTPNYFDQNLIGAQADQEVLKDLLREKMPILWRHLTMVDIELSTITLNWFLAVFFDCVPFETQLRIWDCFLLEGPKVLFRFSLAILKLNEKAILSRHETVSIMRQLKAAAKLCFDVDSLFKTAFEELKPFTRRQDISTKQTCYFKTLMEHAKKMEVEKVAVKDKERMLSEIEIMSTNQLVIECAAVYDKDKLWLCHGHQNGAQISKVNCEENIMYRLNIELESRVMCMHTLDDETILLGTLSHFVHAYSTRARRLVWETRLNDAVLAISSHEEDGLKQVYAGLADGTIAVIENVQGQFTKPETFYIMIGTSPVTCISLVGRRLWCGSGNRVIILSARTLDTVDQFQTSSSGLDYVSMLVPDELGVWVTIRGSSVLQLWDPNSLACKLLYDVRDNKYPKSSKQQEDEAGVNQARITAVLPFGGSVLVGTAEGSLIIYDISTRISRSASSSDFNQRKPFESTSVDHIQERIQELLLEQKIRDEADGAIFMSSRKKSDSGCCSTPNAEAQSRRESQPSDSNQHKDSSEDRESSPEDPSESTSVNTICRAGENADRANDPESQVCRPCEETDANCSAESSGETIPDEKKSSADRGACKQVDVTDKDSGRSSSSAHGNQLEDGGDDALTKNGKRLCTCHQLSGNSGVKCRHCLLETSEALRQLFSKYSLGKTQANHVDASTRYQNLLNTSKILRSEIFGSSIDVKNDLGNDEESRQSGADASEWHRIVDMRNRSSSDKSGDNDNVNSRKGSRDSQRRNRNSSTNSIILDQSGSPQKVLLRTSSADDVTKWVQSQENLSSSLTSDSYDFDDVFVAYTEDEASRNGSGNPRTRGGTRSQVPPSSRRNVYVKKDVESVLESIRSRALSRRRSSNIFEYAGNTAMICITNEPWPSAWSENKSRSSSPLVDSATSVSSASIGRYYSSSMSSSVQPRLLDVRTQLPAWGRGELTSESDQCTTAATRNNENASGQNGGGPKSSTNSWLSYEDSVTDNDSSIKIMRSDSSLHPAVDWSSSTQKGSDTASVVSFNSTEVPYTFELNLQEKIKISDKPIKCLLQTKCGGEPTIISCAGCYGDDEAVLKWTKIGDEKLWTNDPIIEVCPYTNAIKPSPYARSRLPRRTTSLASMSSELEGKSSNNSRNIRGAGTTTTSSSATSVVGSGLAKVQNMFLRVHDKV